MILIPGGVPIVLFYDYSITDPGQGKPAGGEFYNERIVQSQWEKQRRWSKVYKKRRAELQFFRATKLAFVSFGAVAQVAATQVPAKYKTATSIVGSILVAAGAYIKNNYTTKDKVEDMVTSMYISAAIKSEVIKFRAKAAPYAGKARGDALKALRERCNLLSGNGSDDKRFMTAHADSKPVPIAMDTREEYLDLRLDQVINGFYIKQGKAMEWKHNFCERIETVLLGGSSAIGFARTQALGPTVKKIVDSLTGWAGALTTVSAAFANHNAKMKFEELADEYYNTAKKLTDIKNNWPMKLKKAGDPGWDEQIAMCERIMLSTIEDFAKTRAGGDDIMFNKPKRKKVAPKGVWNPNVVVGNDESGSFPAKDRAQWLVDNKKVANFEEAKKVVMKEYPEAF